MFQQIRKRAYFYYGQTRIRDCNSIKNYQNKLKLHKTMQKHNRN